MAAVTTTINELPSLPPLVVVGLGATGLSMVRFLARRGVPLVVTDSRSEPPELESLLQEFPELEVRLGTFDAELFSHAAGLLLSPGVSPHEAAVREASACGVPVLGDIELFARHARAPIVAISGSNGKSTVTTLLGEMARAAGRDVRVGGNLGTPALDLLNGPVPDLYVLELSSFQLEVTRSLNALAAVVLNVSDDHLDRHGTRFDYAAIKQRVYAGSGTMVINIDDPLVASMADPRRPQVGFSLSEPRSGAEYGVLEQQGEPWLAKGLTPLLPCASLRIPGRHNWANALAALALGEAAGLPLAAMLQALTTFSGLAHRCEWVRECRGVNWYDDSKGTNVGATLAALHGMPGGKVVLIAGGQGKGQDFAPLRSVVAERARALVLFGEDAALIERALGGTVAVLHAADLPAAVASADTLAQPGDSVLLSPACASFDMFRNYVHRAEVFVAAVQGLPE